MSASKINIILICFAIITSCKARNTNEILNNIQADTASVISGSINISGAYALYPLVQKWADDFIKLHAGIKINIFKTGSGQGIADILAGKSQLTMISRSLTDEEIHAGIWTIPVAKDGVVPIVNQNNPYIEKLLSQGLSPNEYLKAFTNERTTTWGELLGTSDKENVMVFSRADESGAADVFADFLYIKSSDLKGRKVTGDEEMIKSVQENLFSLGFCNFSYAFDPSSGERKNNIQIVPSDLDFDNKIERKEVPFNNLESARRCIWLGIYPKVLCRELTFGSLGKPSDPVIVEFLRYVLTEGQHVVEKTTLCELNSVYIRYSMEKLK
jgi:phosphate transport system substrate-binding protein